MLELHKGLLPCSRQRNSTLPSRANRADQACHLLAHSDMTRDSCNHTAPGTLQEPPSPCTSSSPFCPAKKKRPWSKLEIQAVRSHPARTARIHPNPMDQQKSNLSQAQRLWERAAGVRIWTQKLREVCGQWCGTAFFLWVPSTWEPLPHSSYHTGL